jgi:hypothetical protein
MTARALAEALLPGWAAGHPPGEVPWYAARVVARYGDVLRRPEQLVRKLTHFDGPLTALRYVTTQGRRNVREVFERRFRRRSARARLSLPERS